METADGHTMCSNCGLWLINSLSLSHPVSETHYYACQATQLIYGLLHIHSIQASGFYCLYILYACKMKEVRCFWTRAQRGIWEEIVHCRTMNGSLQHCYRRQ